MNDSDGVSERDGVCEASVCSDGCCGVLCERIVVAYRGVCAASAEESEEVESDTSDGQTVSLSFICSSWSASDICFSSSSSSSHSISASVCMCMGLPCAIGNGAGTAGCVGCAPCVSKLIQPSSRSTGRRTGAAQGSERHASARVCESAVTGSVMLTAG